MCFLCYCAALVAYSINKWVGLGRIQSFMLILGRVMFGHFTCGSGWVGSRKLDPRPTLTQTPENILENKSITGLFFWPRLLLDVVDD